MDFKIKVVSGKDEFYIKQCLEIAKENHVKNGGTLNYEAIVQYSKYVICAVQGKQVLGYVGMVKDFLLKDDFYVYQIAVAKAYAGNGIGSALMNYVKHHSKGFPVITSNVMKNNESSNKMHLKAGFTQLDTSSDEYTYILKTDNIAENEYISFSEDDKILED